MSESILEAGRGGAHGTCNEISRRGALRCRSPDGMTEPARNQKRQPIDGGRLRPPFVYLRPTVRTPATDRSVWPASTNGETLVSGCQTPAADDDLSSSNENA